MLRHAILLALPALLASCGKPSSSPTAEPAPAPGVSVAGTTWLLTGPPGSGQPTGGAPSATLVSAPIVQATGTFLPYRAGSPAVTYDPKIVPAGSTATITISSTPYGTQTALTAAGLLPRRAYGAHLHTQPCTGAPAAAGPHYQHRHDPAASPSAASTNPAYANPANEIWLDFTADASGAGNAVSKQSWSFPATQGPRSLVIHDKPGAAGARVACLTLS